MTNKGCSLSYADSYLRGDKEIVVAALTQDGSAWECVEFVANYLHGDKEIFLAIVASPYCSYGGENVVIQFDHFFC